MALSKREDWIDAVRGLAIYLVVLGHCIQYATPNNYDYNANELFTLIYSFHMPLFMCVSGYLFFGTLERYDLLHTLLSKLKGIMVPCAVWGLVTYIVDILCNGSQDISLWGYINYTIYSNWFLWAVFYCSLAGMVIYYVFKGNILAYIIFVLVNFLTPVFFNLDGAKRMLPFFLMGMLANKYGLREKLGERGYMAAIGIIYVLSMLITPLRIEIITGTFGSGLICGIFYCLCKKYKMSLLRKLGKVSIGIYLLSGIIFWFLIKEYGRIEDSYRYMIKAGYVVGLSVVLTAVCYGVCIILQKFKITNKLFLGKWQ